MNLDTTTEQRSLVPRLRHRTPIPGVTSRRAFTGATAHTYDAAGNLLTRTDAKGQTASYSYDALNRLTGIAYSGGTAPAQTVSYQYDQGTNGTGRLTRIADGTGTTGYSYDAWGRLAGITYPSGRTVGYSFDGMGRINRIATSYNGTAKVLASNIAYQPFGGVQSFTYGDGLTAPVQTYTRRRDLDGRITGYTLGGQALTPDQPTYNKLDKLVRPKFCRHLIWCLCGTSQVL